MWVRAAATSACVAGTQHGIYNAAQAKRKKAANKEQGGEFETDPHPNERMRPRPAP
jgi:hypothetical protein